MQKFVGLAAVACIGLAVISPAQATPLLGAKTILISNAASTTDTNLEFIQIGEVIATQAITHADVALASNGATASATSQYSSTSGPDKAIDGHYPAGYYDFGIYHSGGNNGTDVLTISLLNPFDLASLTIYNRGDGGFSARDIYDVRILDDVGTQIYQGILNDSAAPGPVTVNFVPEPATWAMFLLGLGALGFAAGQRRRGKPVCAV